MTFYWWSHWFWITALSVILLQHITIIHTYPSQDISLDYNQQQQQPKETEDDKVSKTVTKLYQTTATVGWVTAVPTNIKDNAIDHDINVNAKLKNALKVSEALGETIVTDIEEAEVEDTDIEHTTLVHSLENEFSAESQNNDGSNVDEEEVVVEQEEEKDEEEVEQQQQQQEEAEYKRSAEATNQTNQQEEQQQEQQQQPQQNTLAATTVEELEDAEIVNVQQQQEQPTEIKQQIVMEKADISNYTNFSSIAIQESENSINKNGNQSAAVNTSNLIASAAAAPPAAPRIDIKNISAIELAKAIAQLPQPSHVTVSGSDADNADMPTNNVQKVPFTLENANKEEELRRAENEHRSRKSKVLTADYKSINRYINYSTDSKSLLTRSASTAPNDFEDDAGNISSEALSVQRNYFLDASTISAICFTVFGICCTVGTIGLVLYRRRYLLNKPQTLSEPDSSVYIDDSTIRDNSDEMYSLDNDSFLNSLEAMTIQNYWTDTVKHTKL